MDTYVGLDFGGTKLLIGEIDGAGHVLNYKRYPTGVNTQEDAVNIIFKSLKDYMATVGFCGNVRAAGVGIVGIVDHENGKWVSMGHEMKGPAVPLAKMLEECLQVPCGVDNDVRSATTAELLLGYGRESQDFVYINVGTGLAAGTVTGGKIIRGANNNSGEIGHMVVDFSNRRPCVCGRKGCAENSVSGTGFTQRVKEYGRKDLLNENGKADVLKVIGMAKQGDEECREILEYGAETLANVIMNLVRFSDPNTVILGGGVAGNHDFINCMEAFLEKETMRGVTNGILYSSFDPDYAGLIGAASVGMAAAGSRGIPSKVERLYKKAL